MTELLAAAKAYFVAMDDLADTPVTRLRVDDPRFAAVKETRAQLRAAVAKAEALPTPSQDAA